MGEGQKQADIQKSLDGSIESAGAGMLRLEPDAALNAKKACQKMLDDMRTVQRGISDLANIGGLDGFDSSVSLRDQRLKPKTGDSNGGAAGSFGDTVRQHIITLEKMVDLYDKAGRAYLETEFESKREFKNISGAVITTSDFDQA